MDTWCARAITPVLIRLASVHLLQSCRVRVHPVVCVWQKHVPLGSVPRPPGTRAARDFRGMIDEMTGLICLAVNGFFSAVAASDACSTDFRTTLDAEGEELERMEWGNDEYPRPGNAGYTPSILKTGYETFPWQNPPPLTETAHRAVSLLNTYTRSH